MLTLLQKTCRETGLDVLTYIDKTSPLKEEGFKGGWTTGVELWSVLLLKYLRPFTKARDLKFVNGEWLAFDSLGERLPPLEETSVRLFIQGVFNRLYSDDSLVP